MVEGYDRMRNLFKNQVQDGILKTMSQQAQFPLLKPITFVTGKGGVGKSVIAAAVALLESQKGKKIHLVELGEKSFYEKFFHLKRGTIQYQPTEIAPNLFISLWSYRSCLREYVGFYIKSQKLYDLFFENPVMQKFIQIAPALKELAILGKATSAPRNVGPTNPFDYLIIDSYSTGHHKALLTAPLAMSQTIHQGPMGYHSQKIFEVICDPDLSTHLLVLRPEDLPTIEGLEFYHFLKDKWNIQGQIILNQYLQFPKTTNELKELMQLTDDDGIQKICQYFYKVSVEQENCFLQVRQEKAKAVCVPYSFDKEDVFAFLSSLNEKIKPL